MTDDAVLGHDGQQVTFDMPAGAGTRFAPGCMDGQIGRVINARLPGRAEAVSVKVVAAAVIDDGNAVRLTVVREPTTP